MATLEDLDVQALVNKFLSRSVVVSRNEDTSDTAEEVTAILESISLAFLLFPQIALSIILRARNTLRQHVNLDLQSLDFMLAALEELQNPDTQITDASDLVEAKTALFELDSLGRIDPSTRSFSRFRDTVNRFLDNQLARTVKRRGMGEFERMGSEARVDLQNGVLQFTELHTLLMGRLEDLFNAVSDFRSVDLRSMVSTRTISRVRSLITQLQNGVQQNVISPTVLAVELLAALSSLESIAGDRDVFDPMIDTGSLPIGRTIVADAVPVAATALSTPGPWDFTGLGSWELVVQTESATHNIFPILATDAVWVATSAPGQATFNIPAGYKLYVLVDAAYFVIPLTVGAAVPIATLQTDINSVLSPTALALLLDGLRLILVSPFPTASITVLGFGRAVDTLGTLDGPSAHEILGFLPNQISNTPGFFSAADLVDLCSVRATTAVLVDEGGALRISSASNAPNSSLAFSGDFDATMGFIDPVESEPLSLRLREGTDVLVAEDEGLSVGSRVTTAEVGLSSRSLSERITALDGPDVFVDPAIPLPRGSGLSVRVESLASVAVQDLLARLSRFRGIFDQDFLNIQKVLPPLLSRPSLAQVNDARRVFQVIRGVLSNNDPNLPGLLEVLSADTVPPQGDPFESSALELIKSLEDRGLDRASDLLRGCQFSNFFALAKDSASKGGNLLTSIASVVRSEFPIVTDEEELGEGNPTQGVNPDTDLLPGAEPSE